VTDLGAEKTRPRRWPREAVRREAKLEHSDDDGDAICLATSSSASSFGARAALLWGSRNASGLKAIWFGGGVYASACCDARGGELAGEGEAEVSRQSVVIRSAARARPNREPPGHRNRSVSAAVRALRVSSGFWVGGGRAHRPRFRRLPRNTFPHLSLRGLGRASGCRRPGLCRPRFRAEVGPEQHQDLRGSIRCKPDIFRCWPWPLESNMPPVNCDRFSTTKIQKENQRSFATGQAELLFLETKQTKQSLSCCNAGYPSTQAAKAKPCPKLQIRIFTSRSL
jgi:hypothetical protein